MTDLTPDEDGFTELVDPDVPRVDLVGSPANGAPGWLLMKQDTQAGLMSPQTIRDLIGKSVTADPVEETVTMTGSPGAIAKLMYEAALRARQRETEEPAHEQLVKAKYHADDLKRMAANGQAMDDESYPIADKEDLSRAIRAVGRGGSSHAAIRRHIIHRAKALGASSEIPDNWAADGSLKEGSVSKMIGGEMDDGQDGLDPTVVLASPEDVTEAPGDPNDPGSPAWEAIDAATARKWTSILARARGALEVMADREMLEAAGADPSDAEDAYDLQDAASAIDYAISLLAPFAVDEQAEADCGTDMAAVGKALADYDPAGLDTIEVTAAVRKAGRVLSASNEEAIRRAVDSLQHVLASLPAAPVEKSSGPGVAKTANEEPNMSAAEPSSDVTEASGQESAVGAKEPEPVGKADGEKTPMVVVYDQKGRLIGIVDPSDVTPVANAEADADDMDADDGSGDSTDDTQTTDLDPQPADEAGTPADAAPDDNGTVTKQDETTVSEMFKSSLLAAVEDVVKTHSANQAEQIAKTGDAVLELAELVETLKGRIGTLEEQPAEPKIFTQGAGPTPQHLRGQDHGAPGIDVTKAQELKKSLMASTDAVEQRDIAARMNQQARLAFDQLQQRG